MLLGASPRPWFPLCYPPQNAHPTGSWRMMLFAIWCGGETQAMQASSEVAASGGAMVFGGVLGMEKNSALFQR